MGRKQRGAERAEVGAGWGTKPGARIIFGRWQDVLPQLEQYDGIFFDTYGDYYEDLRWASPKPSKR